jgi:hypothetical protein
MQNSSILDRLQSWYSAQCNGDWEHSWGITIDNLDNPGWNVKIDLNETLLEDVAFKEIKIDYDDKTKWIFCHVEDKQFHAACGPNQLAKVLEIFLDWADSLRSK